MDVLAQASSTANMWLNIENQVAALASPVAEWILPSSPEPAELLLYEPQTGL